MKYYVTVSIVLIAFVLFAYNSTRQPKESLSQHEQPQQEMAHNGQEHTHEDMDHSGHSATEKKDIPVQTEWKVPADIKPNQDTKMNLFITDKVGKPIENFDINHEKKMHLIVISKDLSFFNHIHPEYKGKGEFEVTTQFPAGGDYKLISDFIPTGGKQKVEMKWMNVSGRTAAPKPLQPESNLTKVVDGKEITLSFDQLKTGMELNMNFTIKDANTKKPITNLQPYLGAIGHVVIMSADAENYLHVHPMEGQGSGPDAKFMTEFSKSGIYKIWGQFQHEGKVFTVPFVVKVP
jgi:hypothetical protein